MNTLIFVGLYLVGTVIFGLCWFPVVNKWFKRDRINPYLGKIKREDDVIFTMFCLGSVVSAIVMCLVNKFVW